MSDAGADVLVVGAGPAGGATAIACARAGVSTLLLEKSPTWPRTKPCGDGLTPRAVRALTKLGMADAMAQWHRVDGLIGYGIGGRPSADNWPIGIEDLPATGYVVPRSLIDAAIVARARQAGAQFMTGASVRQVLFDDRGRACGVELADGRRLRAGVVVDASGPSSRLGAQAGMPRLEGLPMAVAVRGYLKAGPGCDLDPRQLHSWLALPDMDGVRLPGYGWIFPMGDGLFNVGVGQLSTSASFRRTNYRELLGYFVGGLPQEWGMTWVRDPRPAAKKRNGVAKLVAEPSGRPVVVGAALPMGIDRRVVYRRGVLLTGDAAGLVNPVNGEGVSYALESGLMAGEAIAEAAAAPGGWGSAASELALQGYHHELKAQLGGYFRLGRGFAKLIAHDAVMDFSLRRILPNQRIMRPVNRFMANLLFTEGGNWTDRTLRRLQRLATAV